MKIQRSYKIRTFLSFKGRLLVFALCSSLIPIAIITTVSYFYSRSSLNSRVMDQMEKFVKMMEIPSC